MISNQLSVVLFDEMSRLKNKKRRKMSVTVFCRLLIKNFEIYPQILF